MKILTADTPRVGVVALEGSLDARGVRDLEDTVAALLDQGRDCLLFDLSALDYINSSGLRILIMAYQKLHPAGGRVAVCGTRDYIQELFDIAGYDKIFPMFASRETALETL